MIKINGDTAMATTSTKHFDILDFIKKSKALGVDERVAELQARQIEQLVETVQEQQQEYTTRLNALEAKEPATKKDLEVVKLELQKEIIETKGSLQKEIEILRAEINYPAAEQRGMQYHFKITAIDNLCVLPYNQGCPDS
jgi:anaerobic ribonucleoside-triphosphate reductase